MPHPKRKISKTRRDKRRTHYKAALPGVGKCPNCNEVKLNHAVCNNCGYYNGRVIIQQTETT